MNGIMMNDSISISSSSAGSSQSNSLNRSSTNSSSHTTNSGVGGGGGSSGEAITVVVGSASSSSAALGVSISSSSGASPVLPVRHRRNPNNSSNHRQRAKSQIMMTRRYSGGGDDEPSASSASSSSAASTRPVSLNTDTTSGTNSLLEHNRQLMEDLFELKRQLKQRDMEIERLVDVRNRLESEMQDLSASLFEQAYLMVNSARAEAAQSDKLLKEANGKIDVLQAEVKALKELVLNTSNSSTPNQKSRLKPFTSSSSSSSSSHARQSSLNHQALTQLIVVPPPSSTSTPSTNHLTQQIVVAQSTNSLSVGGSGDKSSSSSTTTLKHSASSTTQPISLSVGKEKPPLASKDSTSSGKHHRRLPSDQAKSFIDKIFHHSSSSSLNSSSTSQKSSSNNDKRLSREVKYESLDRTGSIDANIYEQEAVEHDMNYYEELIQWRQKPELTASSSPFLTRIYAEDIVPCLNFNNDKPCDELLAAILENHVCIEDISNQSADNSMNKVCGLSNVPGLCQYKIKLTENGQWIYISRLTRNRIISVCDFFTYLRYIKDGLVKSDVNEIYWYIIDLRRKMALSRLGL